MNINSNEILLLNKKIKLGEIGPNAEEQTSLVASEEQEALSPQTAMNALMFKGLNNVVSNPSLSATLNVMQDVEPEEIDEDAAKDYVVPFQSNITFQGGNANKFKNIAVATLLGLGTVAGMTSCQDDKEIEKHEPAQVTQIVTVNVDLSAITNLVSVMESWIKAQEQHNKIEEENQAKQLLFLQELLEQAKQTNNNSSQILSMLGQWMVQDEANQQATMAALKALGMSVQDIEANVALLKAYVAAGDLEKVAKLVEELLGVAKDIKSLISDAIKNISTYFDQLLSKIDQVFDATKKGFEEVINNGNITNSTLDEMKKQNADLISINNSELAAINQVGDAINNLDIDMNANFDKVIEELGADKDEVIATLNKVGYSTNRVISMNAWQLKNAINNVGFKIDKVNKSVEKITGFVSILPALLEEHKITNSKVTEIFNAYIEISNSEDKYSQETLNKIDKLIEKIENIETIVGDIRDEVKGIRAEIVSFHNDYNKNKDKYFNLLSELVQDNKFNKQKINEIANTTNEMNKNISNLKGSVSDFKAMVQNNFGDLKVLLQDINNGNSDIRKEDIEAMLNKFGLTLTQAINMSQEELLKAINKFENTYIKTEESQTNHLASIDAKLDNISIWNGADKTDILNAINKVTVAINNGKTDVTAELNDIEAAINKLQATVDAYCKQFAQYAANIDKYFQKWDIKFDSGLSSLENIEKELKNFKNNQAAANESIKTYLAAIKSDQKDALLYTKDIDNEIKNLKVVLQNLKLQGGDNFDYKKFDQMWKEHDAANYEKYSKLIKDLGIDPSKFDSIEALLKSIDGKADYIKVNTEILGKIYDKLKDVDFTNPNYNAKLDQIIDILKNFRCQCQCGGNTEGTLKDLDSVLG